MGKVNLKVELIENTPNPDKVVALAAKLCYSSSDIGDLKAKIEKKEQDAFIEKLILMNHFSPIEHVSFTFGIEGVSRALLAQITRHRIASFSVQSQRYVGVSQDFSYIIPKSIENLGKDAVEQFELQMKTIGTWYEEWQTRLGGNNESSNEDARFVLPNASETKMVLTMNARELMHFFELRCCERAQWEIRELAWQMLALVKKAAPSLFKKAGASCVFKGCKEGEKCCGKQKKVINRADSL